MEETIAFLDFETTGLEPANGHRPTEVAVVFVKNQTIVDRFQSFMNPGRSIPTRVALLTGISDAMVKHAPDVSTVFETLAAKITGVPVVAHKANFERKFMHSEYRRIGQSLQSDVYCSCSIARRVFQGLPNYKLKTLATALGLSFQGSHHRAMPDAEMTAQLWIAMERELQRRHTLQVIPLALMARLQKVRIKSAHRDISRYLARCKSTRLPQHATRKRLKRGRSMALGVPRTQTKTPRSIGPERLAAPRQGPREVCKKKKLTPIPAELLPENALRPAPLELRSEATPRPIPPELLPENVPRPAKRAIPRRATNRPIEISYRSSARAARHEEQSLAEATKVPSIKCMGCGHHVPVSTRADFPWVKCDICEAFTPKPLQT